ncbi:hypothetical protein G4F95_31005, partial [Escherichia coli]|nr:hypothetical protein [Escherichia coli]
MNKIFKVIWN